MQYQYIFFDCMETIVDLYELPSCMDYAGWTYYGSGMEEYWTGFSQFMEHYDRARQQLALIYAINQDYEMYERIRFTVEYNDKIDTSRKDMIAKKLYQNFWKTYRSKCYVDAGKRAVLKALSEQYRLAVVSNFKVRNGIEELLMMGGVRELFDFLIISINQGWRKPDQCIYQSAIAKAGCTLDEILFIGDDFENDYILPKKMGMDALLYNPSTNHPEAASFRNFKELELLLL